MSAFLSLASSSDQPAKGSTIIPDVTSGHSTHLTLDQQAALTSFKDILAKARLYSPPNDPDRPRPSHDEPTLLLVPFSFIFPRFLAILHTYLPPPARLSSVPHASSSRFLRARRFDPHKASKQFADAALAAAKVLEPKTQRVHLTSATLKTPDEIKAWLAKTETELLAKLATGPVVIS